MEGVVFGDNGRKKRKSQWFNEEKKNQKTAFIPEN